MHVFVITERASSNGANCVTPTADFFRMPLRRNPNNVYANMDEDTRNFQRSANIRDRSRILSDRLLDNRQRTMGVDMIGLNEQINDRTAYMKRMQEKERHELLERNAFNERERMHENDKACRRKESYREYGEFLKAQYHEKQIKRSEETDFDPKYLIGNQPNPREDGEYKRRKTLAYREQLRMQIEAKVSQAPDSGNIPLVPVVDSTELTEYREKMRRDFVDGNRQILLKRAQIDPPIR